jgi:hypothetical protein
LPPFEEDAALRVLKKPLYAPLFTRMGLLAANLFISGI